MGISKSFFFMQYVLCVRVCILDLCILFCTVLVCRVVFPVHVLLIFFL